MDKTIRFVVSNAILIASTACLYLPAIEQYVDTTYRNSSRILLDDHALAREILERMKPYLKEIDYMDKSPLHKMRSNEGKRPNEPPARLAALNERLRFLKYGPGK